jgi:hypothetical protein
VAKRHRRQRWLFGTLAATFLVIGLLVGVLVPNWTVAALFFGLSAMELMLWFMAGRR